VVNVLMHCLSGCTVY